MHRGGIGKATALTLASRGCSIAVHYHSNETSAKALVTTLDSSLQSIGVTGGAAAFQADLSDYEMVKKLHKEVVDKMGHPDILFNNAGVTNKVIGPTGDIGDVSVEEFEATWKTNTGSSYLVSSKLSHISRQGSRADVRLRIADPTVHPVHGI